MSSRDRRETAPMAPTTFRVEIVDGPRYLVDAAYAAGADAALWEIVTGEPIFDAFGSLAYIEGFYDAQSQFGHLQLRRRSR